MFDTMTMTKATGAICGALLIYLLGVWFAETLYHSGGGHGAHGEEHAKAYVIDTGSHGDDAAADEGPNLATLLASADAGKGERAFSKCKACHKVTDGDNGVGPHLFGLVGRGIGSVEGYSYSSALAGLSGDTWTPEALDAWLENPGKFAKGTKMAFKTPKINDRVNLIAYLQSVGQ